MKLIIRPYLGVGRIEFIMSRITIRSILGPIAPYEEFYRTDDNHTPSDQFKSLGLIVSYNENYLCDALEFANPAELFFDELSLLDISYKTIISYFLKKDPKIEEDDSGFISLKIGIGAYAPYKVEDPFPCAAALKLLVPSG